jgi:hypothetical protein
MREGRNYMKLGRGGKFWSKACVILLVFLSAGLVFADQGDPPARVATVSYVSGKVSLEPAGVNQWSDASLNYPMTNNDRLYTDQGARAEINIGSTAVRLWEATDLTLANLSDTFLQLGLAQGSIHVSVYQLPSGTSIEVDTPNGALTLLQPGYYRVDTFPSDNSTLVSVQSGQIQLSGGGLSQTVQSGQAVKLTGTGPIQVTFVSLPPQDSFDQWSAARDQQFNSGASAYVSRDMPGYYALNGYGSWSQAPQYGPIWYPSAVPVGWVPYSYGSWVWVNPWGWTWLSSEPWGFAPFHYGRWAFIGARWGWVPGPVVATPYYAPALVAFVGGAGFSIGVGGVGFSAWFPLGPREPYYPWYHSGNTYLRQVNITNIRNVTNITNIVNVQNAGRINYVNRARATTVVRASTFSNGQPVQSARVRMSAAQLAKTQVIPHPEINPTRSAALAGKAVAAPSVSRSFVSPQARQRLASVKPVGAPANPGSRSTAPTTAPNRSYHPAAGNGPPSTARPNLVTRGTPSSTGGTRATTPARTATARGNAPAARGYPSTSRPQLITRKAPPPASVPFRTKLQAMQSHPGRALEPQQVSNLRAGKPAGPMRDKEYIPHATHSQPARQQRSAPSKPKSEPRTKH